MSRTYIGLGAFVLGTLALLLWLAQSIGALGESGGSHYEVRLEHAAGLVTNNAVKIAGVEVGSIQKVSVDHDIAVLSLRIDADVVLHTDATAIVRAKSLLGEKYLQLHPGSVETPVLDDGGVITHIKTHFEIDQVLNALEPVLGGTNSLAAMLGPLVESLTLLLDDASGREGQAPIVTRAQLEQVVDDVTTTSATVRRIATENEQDVRALVEGSRRLIDDQRLDRLLTRSDRISATIEQRLPALLDRTEAVLTKLESAADVVDGDRAKTLGRAIDDAAAAMANIRDVSTEFSGLAKSLHPLLIDLGRLAHRALALDGPTLRAFMQKEGVKVYVGTGREAAKSIDD